MANLNRKVRHVRLNVGIQMIGNVLTSVDTEKHGAYMEMWPMGVFVSVKFDRGGKSETSEKVIPYAQVQYLDLLPEAAESTQSADSAKKGKA